MKKISTITFVFFVILVAGCSNESEIDTKFTIAVIPDTQNYVDFRHQINEGFPINSADLFIEQLEYVAQNTSTNGGEIEFVTSVGDVWQHTDIVLDPEHEERGFNAILFNPRLSRERILRGIEEFEIPLTKKGYDLIGATNVPFGVAPGNHDYDTGYQFNPFPDEADPRAKIREQGLIPNRHVGGYNRFNSVFGPESPYFKGKKWYVSSFNGGVNSAQIFDAGGYQFLHFSFEMQAGDAVLAWAQNIIDQYPGLPTIMSTHDFLNPKGERKPSPFYDLDEADPLGHNSAEEIWDEFIRVNDQIFLVLSGHQIGQSIRIDDNDAGNKVYQILTDYQGRGMAANPPEDAERITGIGDGWLRLLDFDMSATMPIIEVKAYSTFYKSYSGEFSDYVNWYRDMEQPEMSAEEFLAADHYTIELDDFKERFGEPK